MRQAPIFLWQNTRIYVIFKVEHKVELYLIYEDYHENNYHARI
jgi:hypothetical protein